MGKKKVEDKNFEARVQNILDGDTGLSNVVLEPIEQELKAEPVSITPRVEEVQYKAPKQQVKEARPLVNCLRYEKIIVRFIPRPGLVRDTKHVLYGGMSESATRSFVVPRLSSTGLYVNVLTNDEMAFLENIMGLEPGTMSIYKRKDNFWSDSNPNGIGKVVLNKQDNYLDLSVPEDYIKYKVLLANKNQIAPSVREMEDRPKATYQYVIVSETSESKSNLRKMDATMECYMEYGRVRDDVDILRTIIELLDGRPLSARVKTDYLQGKINDYIQSNPRRFLEVIKDPLLPAKVLLKQSVQLGLVGMRNNTYYLRENNTPLCEIGEESTLNNAAAYISSIKHQELKYMLEAKVKENQ